MRFVLLLFIISLLVINASAQEYALKITKVRDSTKVFYVLTGNKVKIQTDKQKDNGGIFCLKANVSKIDSNYFCFKPKKEKFGNEIRSDVRHLTYLEIQTKKSKIKGTVLTIIGAPIFLLLGHVPIFASTYKYIDLESGKWKLEIVDVKEIPSVN